ncbi:hypothetical protein C8R43DRAFT_1116720 [Mycena crocata]|nr:hypothetical protein C8R43DRAFT_1116720 [Mycena crocata]
MHSILSPLHANRLKSLNSEFDARELYDDITYHRITPDLDPRHKSEYDDKCSAGASSEPSASIAPLRQPPRNWSPKLLHALPTGIFGAFLLLLIVGLEVFNRNSPYTVPSPGLKFMWTYVPVGILMVVQWIWTAYDIQIKILVPWAAMSRGPVPAAEGWLLDYVGANPFVTLWTAFKYRHVVVLFTTVGLWVTALAGIVATSLFQLEDTLHTTAVDFNLATGLYRSLLTDFDPAILDAKQYVSSYLGRQILNLSRPQWSTADDIVLEAFSDTSGWRAERWFAQTRGYSVNLECQPAPASYGGNVSIRANPPTPFLPVGYAIFVDILAAGCQVTYPLTDTNHLLVCSNGPTCYVGRVYNHTCPGSLTYTTAVVLARTTNFTFVSATAVECSPSYSEYVVDVSVAPTSSAPVNSTIVSRSADAVMNDSLHGMLQWLNTSNSGPPRANTVTGSNEMDTFFYWGDVVEDGSPCDCDPWLFLIAHAQHRNISDFMEPGTLLNASVESFPGVFADVAQALLMSAAPASSAPLPGTVERVVRQLVARPTSVRIAQATMSLLLILVIAVYFYRPHTNLPMNPASIASQVLLMTSNHEKLSGIIQDTITQTSAESQTLLGTGRSSGKASPGNLPRLPVNRGKFIGLPPLPPLPILERSLKIRPDYSAITLFYQCLTWVLSSVFHVFGTWKQWIKR